MSNDPWDDPIAQQWVQHVLHETAPMMADSAIMATIVPGKEDDEYDEGDVKYWVELGAMIMMGKPIVVIAVGQRQIPPKLELIADEIVRLPEGVNPAAAEEVAAAFRRVMDKL